MFRTESTRFRLAINSLVTSRPGIIRCFMECSKWNPRGSGLPSIQGPSFFHSLFLIVFFQVQECFTPCLVFTVYLGVVNSRACFRRFFPKCMSVLHPAFSSSCIWESSTLTFWSFFSARAFYAVPCRHRISWSRRLPRLLSLCFLVVFSPSARAFYAVPCLYRTLDSSL